MEIEVWNTVLNTLSYIHSIVGIQFFSATDTKKLQ